MTEGTSLPPRSSFPDGARCAHHPERLAERTCLRCGNYMCGQCSADNARGLCLSCAARLREQVGFPYDRDNFTFDGLLNLALSRWKEHWLWLAVSYAGLMLLAYLPPFLFGLAVGVDDHFGDRWFGRDGQEPALASAAAQQIIALILQLAAALMLSGAWVDVLDGIPLRVGRVAQRLRALPHALLAMLMVYAGLALCAGLGLSIFWLAGGRDTLPTSAVAVGAYVVLLLPALTYVLLGVSFVNFELAHDPTATALTAIRTSWRAVQGRRWQAMGIGSVAGLIAGAGVLLCCVGMVASIPLAMLLWGGLFLALKRPASSHDAPVIREWPV